MELYDIVEKHGGGDKAVALIVHFITNNYSASAEDFYKEIAADPRLGEVEYADPRMPGRIKSFVYIKP